MTRAARLAGDVVSPADDKRQGKRCSARRCAAGGANFRTWLPRATMQRINWRGFPSSSPGSNLILTPSKSARRCASWRLSSIAGPEMERPPRDLWMKDGGSHCRASAPRVDISRKVAVLASSQVYAERPAQVEIVETHFSWVFLTERYVYKLKKPLRGEGFDFSTAEARRRNAEAEVRLNRRLAPGVYIGVVPLTLYERPPLGDWWPRRRRRLAGQDGPQS